MNTIAPIKAKAGGKTSSRQRAVQEIFNSITLAAVIPHFQDVPAETKCSTDSVGLELGTKKGEKHSVRLAKGSREWLGKRGLQAGKARGCKSSGTEDETGDWLGCDSCSLWVCPKRNCKQKLNNHQLHCSDMK